MTKWITVPSFYDTFFKKNRLPNVSVAQGMTNFFQFMYFMNNGFHQKLLMQASIQILYFHTKTSPDHFER